MGRIARLAKLNRENLYRMLSRRGNPEFRGLGRLLESMGFKLTISLKAKAQHARA